MLKNNFSSVRIDKFFVELDKFFTSTFLVKLLANAVNPADRHRMQSELPSLLYRRGGFYIFLWYITVVSPTQYCARARECITYRGRSKHLIRSDRTAALYVFRFMKQYRSDELEDCPWSNVTHNTNFSNSSPERNGGSQQIVEFLLSSLTEDFQEDLCQNKGATSRAWRVLKSNNLLNSVYGRFCEPIVKLLIRSAFFKARWTNVTACDVESHDFVIHFTLFSSSRSFVEPSNFPSHCHRAYRMSKETAPGLCFNRN